VSTGVLDLMRHGDTGQKSYRGQNDDPLTAIGWQQARAAVAGREWDAVLSSSLVRCAAFARELAAQRGLPLVLDARLMEYHFGAWQGVPIADIAAREGAALGRFWADPVAHPPPGAEPHAAFRARLTTALDDALARWPGQRVLVVTHGGAIRLLRCLVEQRGYGEMASLEVPNASIYRLPWPASAAGAA